MGIIEVVRRRAASGVSKAEFIAANEQFKLSYMRGRHGFQKRTVLRGFDGEWMVLVDCVAEEDARASMGADPDDPASASLNDVIDTGSFE